MDEAYIALVAQDWKNGLRFLGKDVVFYCEDKADENFWMTLFNSLAPQLNIDFHYYTQDINGVSHTGKGMALKFRSYLDKSFMLCLDSDYDYIVSIPDFDIGHYIFQTYTYSIENYKCFAPSLSNLCQLSTQATDPIDFDIETFLVRYSKIIYPLFIYSIANKIRDFGFHISDFSETIKFDHRFTYADIENELVSLQQRVSVKMAQLQLLSIPAEYDAIETVIQNKGITPENAYLFIRGHSLYDDIVLRLVKSIVDNIQKEKIKNLKDSGLSNEIESYLDTCPSIAKLLNKNYNFIDCDVIQKIEADIQSIGF